jgi:tetratricopeptide (TPR) repeat protein
MDRIKIFLLTLFIANSISSFAQDRDRIKAQEYAQEQEQFRKAQVMRELDSAIYLMDLGENLRADEKFKYVLSNIKSVPSDLTYYFGKNSFLLGKYKQSIDWLNKYIQLKGTAGQFSNEALDWKKKAEAEYLKTKVDDSKKVAEVLSTDYTIDCGPEGKVYCPVCKGEHVIIKKGIFGNEYKTCPYCNEHGILTCEEYNLLLRGELQPRQ